ncbi:hypothetical protein GGI35DRAFT_439416 [Trichoderma velutinum]
MFKPALTTYMVLLVVLALCTIDAQNTCTDFIQHCQCQVYKQEQRHLTGDLRCLSYLPQPETICAASLVSRDMPAMHLNLPLPGTFAVGGTCWCGMDGTAYMKPLPTLQTSVW